MKKHIANIITECRILFSLLLLFFPTASARFYIFYLFCGLTDMIDGTIARKMGSVSELGSRLDTVADFVFLAIAFFKFLPILSLPMWLWMWILTIAVIKAITIVWKLVIERKLIAFHSVLNKITGACLFVLPLSLGAVDIKYSGSFVCSIAMIAALQELFVETKKRATKKNSKIQEKRGLNK